MAAHVLWSRIAVDHATLIRSAEQNDSVEIARLCTELGYPVTAEDITARLLTLLGSDLTFVAVVPGAQSGLVGWVAAEHRLLLESGERVEIVGLIVDACVRRGGIGRTLVSAVESWASDRGVSTVFVRSNTARAESHVFFERIGYERTKTQHAYARTVGVG